MYYSKRPTRKKYGRRRRYTGAMRTVGGRSAYTGQLAVYRNAFSTATTNPKIPDGKAFHSSGVRLQAVKEFVNDSTVPMDFLLFPGLNNGIIMAGANTANGRYMPYNSHGVFTGAGPQFTQEPTTAIDKWRVVSQALKITLLNNSDENDGWWEAARVQLSRTADIKLDPTALGNLVGTGAAATELPGVDVARQMVENPTYVTGKLRDIHRHMFQLAPQGADHDFEELGGVIDNTNTQGPLDNNFDAIHIRIHGRTGTESPTRLMLHVVSNQEIVYDEAATLTRYHSETQMTPAFSIAKRRIITGSHKAAKRFKTSLF